uniref:AlNc14C125G6799 protein n=1 Tax=Albugo laibachii Nc14 TaxID=890382 RepID=F0WJS3_9STRA|nr:AlNc14C125G6799 [Albugo laibachii Nc14]|eukprot:CCA21524.1 AlNc14C125G6799 [Albugo laibachii Nc14]
MSTANSKKNAYVEIPLYALRNTFWYKSDDKRFGLVGTIPWQNRSFNIEGQKQQGMPQVFDTKCRSSTNQFCPVRTECANLFDDRSCFNVGFLS